MTNLVTGSELFTHDSLPDIDPESSRAKCSAQWLTREQVVDRILSMNTTARTDFLGSFSDAALRDYLDHLQSATIPRGPHARWVRRNGTRAVAMADSRA